MGAVMIGWLLIVPVPIWTASSDAGGVLGVPLTMTQFEAVSHTELVAPVHRTVPAASAFDPISENTTSPRRTTSATLLGCLIFLLIG